VENYELTESAKEDLIRIHHYGVARFGISQADKYYYNFFTHFELIASNPYSFESISYIKEGYRRCVCGIDSIIYKISGNKVVIISIIGRQDIDQLL
tara:strand:- start:1627 stop:1914 length:288 start_codon:yes stop_codon:yes gene_type:complete